MITQLYIDKQGNYVVKRKKFKSISIYKDDAILFFTLIRHKVNQDLPKEEKERTETCR